MFCIRFCYGNKTHCECDSFINFLYRLLQFLNQNHVFFFAYFPLHVPLPIYFEDVDHLSIFKNFHAGLLSVQLKKAFWERPFHFTFWPFLLSLGYQGNFFYQNLGMYIDLNLGFRILLSYLLVRYIPNSNPYCGKKFTTGTGRSLIGVHHVNISEDHK